MSSEKFHILLYGDSDSTVTSQCLTVIVSYCLVVFFCTGPCNVALSRVKCGYVGCYHIWFNAEEVARCLGAGAPIVPPDRFRASSPGYVHRPFVNDHDNDRDNDPGDDRGGPGDDSATLHLDLHCYPRLLRLYRSTQESSDSEHVGRLKAGGDPTRCRQSVLAARGIDW